METSQLLLDTPERRALPPYVSVTHLDGDCNPPTDLLSRQRFKEVVKTLCAARGLVRGAAAGSRVASQPFAQRGCQLTCGVAALYSA